jgi:hypothetical protein
LRDYDKEPIVIVDKIPEIVFLVNVINILIGIFLILLLIPSKLDNNEFMNRIIYTIVMWIPFFLFLKSRVYKHRVIKLYNGCVIREHDKHTLKIAWENNLNIQKTFIDFYDKNQKTSGFIALFQITLTPIFLLFVPILLFIKYIYKIFHRFSNKMIFDTIMIFDKNNNIISIFIPNKKDKEELSEYFRHRFVDIDDLPIFYTFLYSHDEITHFFNRKG